MQLVKKSLKRFSGAKDFQRRRSGRRKGKVLEVLFKDLRKSPCRDDVVHPARLELATTASELAKIYKISYKTHYFVLFILFCFYILCIAFSIRSPATGIGWRIPVSDAADSRRPVRWISGCGKSPTVRNVFGAGHASRPVLCMR